MKKNKNQEKPTSKMNRIFGDIMRIPLVAFYCISAILIGFIVGVIASIVLPLFLPYQMIKVRFFKDGT